jgi:hypothetical protein
VKQNFSVGERVVLYFKSYKIRNSGTLKIKKQENNYSEVILTVFSSSLLDVYHRDVCRQLLQVCGCVPCSHGICVHAGQWPVAVARPSGTLPVGRSRDQRGPVGHRPVGLWIPGETTMLCVCVLIRS